MADDLRVSWGCGPEIVDGWWCSDRDPYVGLDHHGDLLDGLPLDDGAAVLVHVNHALQMVPLPSLDAALAELTRILAPGGTLRILVPDLFTPHGAVAAWRRGDRAWFPVDDSITKSVGGKLTRYANWYSTALALFTPASLMAAVAAAGCDVSLLRVGWSMSGHPDACVLDSRPAESLVVEGRKR